MSLHNQSSPKNKLIKGFVLCLVLMQAGVCVCGVNMLCLCCLSHSVKKLGLFVEVKCSQDILTAGDPTFCLSFKDTVDFQDFWGGSMQRQGFACGILSRVDFECFPAAGCCWDAASAFNIGPEWLQRADPTDGMVIKEKAARFVVACDGGTLCLKALGH